MNNLPITLPELPPDLNYSTYSEFNTHIQAPALTICVNTPSHNLLSVSIPYDTIPILIHTPNMTPDQELTLYPTMTDDPPKTLTHQQAHLTFKNLTDSIITPIQRTINVYRTLHGTP